MNKKNKKNRLLMGILLMLGCLPSGLLIGIIGYKAGIDIFPIYLLFLLSMGIALVLQTALHEAGHMVFGLLTGFRFLSYRVLSMILSKEDGKLKLGRFSIPGTVGQCLMGTPTDREKKPYYLYNAGGLIFNFIFMVINYLIAFLSRNPYLAIFAAANAMYDLIMLIGNGIPFDGTGIANDGMNIREMKRHPVAIDTFYNILDSNELMSKGARARDIPEEAIDLREETLHTGSIGTSNLLWKENKLMDEHRFNEAEAFIKEILSKDYPLLDYHKKMLLLDQKYIDCLNGCFEDITDKQTLKYLEGARKSALSVIRYFYVRALYLKDEKELEKSRQAFITLEKGYPFKGEYQTEKELMEIAEEKLRQE
ncbi:MAG: hypothetical protein IKS51_03865 [Erysipelotrichaceae bacterium]|nr:hypothetical protein [Erysipelotrichaceae bacterium]